MKHEHTCACSPCRKNKGPIFRVPFHTDEPVVASDATPEPFGRRIAYQTYELRRRVNGHYEYVLRG
jgi:hypothetical protein